MYLGTRFHAAHTCMYSCGGVLLGLILSYLGACIYAGHPPASMQGLFSAVCPTGSQSTSFGAKVASRYVGGYLVPPALPTIKALPSEQRQLPVPLGSFRSSIPGSFELIGPESQAGLPCGPTSQCPFIVVSWGPSGSRDLRVRRAYPLAQHPGVLS
jgi:hypothetical protein